MTVEIATFWIVEKSAYSREYLRKYWADFTKVSGLVGMSVRMIYLTFIVWSPKGRC